MKYSFRKKKKNPMMNHAMYGLIGLLVIVYGVMLYSTSNIYSTLSERTKAHYEATRGPNLNGLAIVPTQCAECYPIGDFQSQLTQAGAIMETRVISHESTEGKDLIVKFGITKIPALLVTGELNRTHTVNNYLNSIGQKQNDTIVIFGRDFVPFLDLTTNKTRGLVELVYLTDTSCTTCYNVSNHKPILQNYGVHVKSERFVDISTQEGKDLAKKYNVTYLPTFIANSEMNAYESMVQVWSQVGAVVEDHFVFTNTEVMKALDGNYTEYKAV